MPVWPFLMSGAGVVIAASALVGNGHALRSSALILCGLLGARLIMAFPIFSEYRDVLFAAMWVTVATFMVSYHGDTLATVTCARLAVFGCALCSLWGRLTEYTMHIWSPPYMTADLMLVLAMLCIAWGLRHDLVDQFSTGTDRGGDLGYDTPVSRIGSLADYQVVAFSAEGGFEKEIARNG